MAIINLYLVILSFVMDHIINPIRAWWQDHSADIGEQITYAIIVITRSIARIINILVVVAVRVLFIGCFIYAMAPQGLAERAPTLWAFAHGSASFVRWLLSFVIGVLKAEVPWEFLNNEMPEIVEFFNEFTEWVLTLG